MSLPKALSNYVVTETVTVPAPLLGDGVHVEVNGWSHPDAVKARTRVLRHDPQTIILNRAAFEAIKGAEGKVSVVVTDEEADRHEACLVDEVIALIADITPWDDGKNGRYSPEKGRELLGITQLAPADLVEKTLSPFVDDAAVRNEVRRTGATIIHCPAKGKKPESWTVDEWKPMSVRGVMFALAAAAARQHERLALEAASSHAEALRPT